MNKTRRKKLRDCMEKLQSATTISEYENTKLILEDTLDSEDEARENIPEGLNGTDKYYDSEEASETINMVIEQIEEAILFAEENNTIKVKNCIFEAVNLLSSIA